MLLALTDAFRRNGENPMRVSVTFHDNDEILTNLTGFDELGIVVEGQSPTAAFRVIPWTAIAVLTVAK